MTPDKFGIYTNTDGSRYFLNPDQSIVNLSYYNPVNGDYAEAGDNTVYSYAGQDTGQVFNGNAVVAGNSAGGTSWLDILNTGLGAAGNIFGNKTPTANAQYTPIPGTYAPPASKGTVWKVLGVLAVVGAVVYIVVKKGKKGAAK